MSPTLTLEDGWTELLPDPAPIEDAAAVVLGETVQFTDELERLETSWAATVDRTYEGVEPEAFTSALVRPRREMLAAERQTTDFCGAVRRFVEELRAVQAEVRALREERLPAEQARVDAEWNRLTAEDGSPWDIASAWERDQLFQNAQQALSEDLLRIEGRWQEARNDLSRAIGDLERMAAPADPVSAVEGRTSFGGVTLADGLSDVFGLDRAGTDTAGEIRDLRDRLSGMTPEQIAVWAAVSDGAAYLIPGWPSTPEELAVWPTAAEGRAWWDGLDAAQQEALLTHLPGVVGSTEGIDFGVRDRANRAALENALAMAPLTDEQRQALENIYMTVVDESDAEGTRRGPDGRPRQLIQLQDIDARPLAAVSSGDLDTVETSSLRVSGMFSGTDKMGEEVARSEGLIDGLPIKHGAVTWLGYDSPGAETVLMDTKARAGAPALAMTTDSVIQTRRMAGNPLEVDAESHSYATPTDALALTMTVEEVRSFHMKGSAGLTPDVTSAEQLHVKDGPEGRPMVIATTSDHVGHVAGGFLSGDEWARIGVQGSGTPVGFLDGDIRRRVDPTMTPEDAPITPEIVVGGLLGGAPAVVLDAVYRRRDSNFGGYVYETNDTGLGGVYPVDGHGQQLGDLDDQERGYDERGTQSFNVTRKLYLGEQEKVVEWSR